MIKYFGIDGIHLEIISKITRISKLYFSYRLLRWLTPQQIVHSLQCTICITQREIYNFTKGYRMD